MGGARIQITAVETSILRSVVELAMTLKSKTKDCQWYTIDEENGIVFYARQPSNPLAVKLPFPLDAEGIADFARRWLPHADYPREPDTDGSTSRGWEADSGMHGCIADDYGAVILIRPWWAVYGK